jgi:phosphoribosylanthranilate isomerase
VRKIHLRYKHQTPRERTWTIHLISLEKVVKATLLIIIGFKLLSLIGSDVHEWAVDFTSRHRFAVLDRFVEPALAKLTGVGDRQLRQFSVAAFIYAGLLLIEGVGLWLQKRWAEYLTSIATALFIPFEIYEIYEKATWVRFGALGINIFIVWYLVTRLRDEKIEAGHSTFVKICGITNLDDAKQAVAAGADAIGFNFYAKSRRHISPGKAGSISAAIGSRASKIGVFVNSSANAIVDAFKLADLDAVQLHGDETDEFIDKLREMLPESTQIIRAVRINPEDADDGSVPVGDAFLVDAFSENEYGGTGRVSNWNAAKRLAASGAIVYLAGGLTPENVREAIISVRPFGVDACSGVESSPGKKDPAKVAAFIKAAKEAI